MIAGHCVQVSQISNEMSMHELKENINIELLELQDGFYTAAHPCFCRTKNAMIEKMRK